MALLNENWDDFLRGGLPALLDWETGGPIYADPYPERYPPDLYADSGAAMHEESFFDSDSAPFLIGGAVLIGLAVVAMLVRR